MTLLSHCSVMFEFRSPKISLLADFLMESTMTLLLFAELNFSLSIAEDMGFELLS